MAQVTNTYDTYRSEARSRAAVRRHRHDHPGRDAVLLPARLPIQLEGVAPGVEHRHAGDAEHANKRVQGDIYSYSAISPTARIGNYTQISMKEFIVSETEEAVSKAGPAVDYDREMMKKGLELRIDMEVTMLGNQASLAGNSTTAPQSAGMRAWIATNDLMGAFRHVGRLQHGHERGRRGHERHAAGLHEGAAR
jgi:hypothetical protein